MTLKGKTVLITGARGQIGRAFIEEFAQNGTNIIAHLRKEDTNFNEFKTNIEQKYNTSIKVVYFDMTDFATMSSKLKDILLKQKIKIDILINNAAVAHGGFFQMTPISKIREIFEINLFAQMELTQIIAKMMIRQKSGIIINMSSILGLDIKEGSCSYGLTKTAIAAWTKTLSCELAQYGIRVNAIAPGLVDTNMATLMEEKAYENMINQTVMKRLAKPEEIAKVGIFLASENSSFVNGQVIRVDGGVK